MSSPIISVEQLGKSYLVGHQSQSSERYTTLRDVVSRNFKSFGRKSLDMARGKQIVQGDEVEEFWALNDVSFDVNAGEVVGVIGRNGAGKSTLLKVLSRITEPTRGRVKLRGRVASLLEVGTGFHPELTGRENIFLNGAILGMARREIRTKFDEIVEFSEVERFLDTPVKRYSSGMYVRLAFAVAAHLDPEILVVDEVLAVGDIQFQKKCLGKIGEVAKGGRTVLFVSHNMGAVSSLCDRCVMLRAGRVELAGPVRDVISHYMNPDKQTASDQKILPMQHLRGSRNAELSRVSLRNCSGEPQNQFAIGEPINLHLHYSAKADIKATAWLSIASDQGAIPVCSIMRDNNAPIQFGRAGKILARIDGIQLLPGTYSISAGLFSSGNDIEDWCEDIVSFDVLDHFDDGRPFDHRFGLLSFRLNWEHGEAS
ncbi:ABC transporter ATP-binding protein [Rubripirellula reticaptiva]|uniref:Teichoic acids export ATP-binding protein TagH n=1 Tax=Rubripirellula reticaptiva TaxID=2528013 RepID=A0A5C6F013_9BACT|nr:ABC transporter ATP-binding protein [Rubripirellula reticaptiva]TWU55223.1 Teichoic acids export ATP-binding protein TagH [Rubripirellula reticaptiva]